MKPDLDPAIAADIEARHALRVRHVERLYARRAAGLPSIADQLRGPDPLPWRIVFNRLAVLFVVAIWLVTLVALKLGGGGAA